MVELIWKTNKNEDIYWHKLKKNSWFKMSRKLLNKPFDSLYS